jgi:hypothetical protein
MIDLAKMDEVLGGGNQMQAVGGIFGRMGVAEEEIKAAQERHPEEAEALDRAFGLLSPPEGMIELADEVYRSHVRDLLDQVAGLSASPRARTLFDDPDPVRLEWQNEVRRRLRPTDAEILGGFSAASQHAPMNRAHTIAFTILFGRVFPEAEFDAEEFAGPTDWERDDALELIEEYREKLARHQR